MPINDSRRVLYRIRSSPIRYCFPSPSTRTARTLMVGSRTAPTPGRSLAGSGSDQMTSAKPRSIRRKVEGTRDEGHERHDGARGEHRGVKRPGSEKGPPEALHDSRHRIQSVDPRGQSHFVELRDHLARRIDHRGDEQPDLDEEGNDVPNVSIFHGEGRQPQTDAHRRGRREQEKERKPEHRHGRPDSVPHHHSNENQKRDREVHDARENRGDRNDESRKVDLGDQVRGAEDCCRRTA